MDDDPEAIEEMESDDALPVSPPPPNVLLSSWRYAPDAWRWARRLDQSYVDKILRLRSGTALPRALRARFMALGLPAEVIESTLREVRSTADWPHAWIRTAQRYLGDFRRQTSASDEPAAAQARYSAALCYHAAQIYVDDDVRTVRLCRAATASLFARAQPYVAPTLRRIEIPWRVAALPAYLAVPETGRQPNGLVVLLNGASTAKEETIAWAAPFLDANLAVLAVDSPGTGEATGIAAYDADHDDIADGVLELAAREPLFDPRRVALVGVSLGGAQALRCVAYDHRLLAAATVTPPFEPGRWLRRASPILLSQLPYLTGDAATASHELATGYDLSTITAEIRCPVLVLGGARDVVVPPTESQRLAAALGALATLIWYPNGGHCLYEYLPAWTAEAAAWIGAIAEARGEGESWSTRVDDVLDAADHGRQRLTDVGDVAPAVHDEAPGRPEREYRDADPSETVETMPDEPARPSQPPA